MWVYVGLFTPYAIWMLRGFFKDFPDELEDSARVDGCTRFGAFMKIILPIAIPGMAAVGVIVFLMAWHLYLVPLILTTKKALVLPVIIGMSQQEGPAASSTALFSAMGLVFAFPTLLLAIVLHKYIISGLLGGALKG
jgi:multiple sugar transport system permease protein